MKFIIAVKSGSIGSLNTAYSFLEAAIAQQKDHLITIEMVFFYQHGIYVLLNSEINQKWTDLLVNNNKSGFICISSCNKRGINKNNIKNPFKPGSIIEFINKCETAERVIYF